MNKQIAVWGKGYLGTKLGNTFDCPVIDRKITNYSDVEAELDKCKPDILINAVGFTGKNNVDDCELEIDKTLSANVFVPIYLAEACVRRNIKFVHISSGCIFRFDYNHDQPIDEEKVPDFFELFYSRSKIYSERSLLSIANRFPILIWRIRVPLDVSPNPKNLLTKLLKYKKVIDVANSVTYLPDFLKAAKHLLEIDAKGIYNIVVKGPLRYHELLEAYKKLKPEFSFEKIEFNKLNIVRTNLVLSVEKLEKTGFKVRGIKEVTEECVREYLKY